VASRARIDITRDLMDGSQLNQLGLKATRPRLRVLAAFESSRQRHLSAEDIYRRVLDAGAAVGVASVYRILAQLEKAGVLRRHFCDAGISVFEVNEGDPHDHLLCIGCGRIEEFKDRPIATRRQKIADAHGYVLSDEPLTMRGYCPGCIKRRGK
jgi:Fur family transcriptional regulator, ferric uptake regulator